MNLTKYIPQKCQMLQLTMLPQTLLSAGGHPSPYSSPRRLRRLDIGAFGARLSGPQHKFLAKPML